MRKVVVFGAGGFIDSYLDRQLKKEGYWVRGVDLKHTEFSQSEADEFVISDLREKENVLKDEIDELYQLATNMGGANYIFTGENDY